MGGAALEGAPHPTSAPERHDPLDPLDPSGTTERVVAVIDAVVRRNEAGVRELAHALGISRSATHRIAQTLARHRVLHALPSGRYEPGARLLSWAASLATRDPLLAVGSVVLPEIAGPTQETAYIVGYGGAGDTVAIVLDVSQGTLPIRYTLAVGSWVPLYAGAAGKAILASLPAELVRAVAPLPLTDGTLVGDALAADLAQVRARGYATSFGERIAAAAGAAAPIFRHGEVVGAFGLSIPRHRLTVPDMTPFGELAVEAAHRVTAALGGVPASLEAADRVVRRAAARPAAGPEAGVAGGREVARVVDVIDAIARCPPPGVETAALAAELGVTPAGAASTLRRLASARVVRRDAHGRHLAEVRLLAWAGLLPDRDVARVARELVAELVAEVGETVCLLTYEARSARGRYALTHPCAHPIQYVMTVGSSAPLHAGAGGKAILAFADRAAWPTAPLRVYTAATVTALDALEAELAKVRARGYATSVGEHLADAAGVAAPYFVDGAVAGSVTITTPRYRFEPARVPELARPLLDCCAELTELLSARPASGAT